MKTHVITTSKGEFVAVDGMGDFAYQGVYCPTCDEDMPMDGVVHCYVCGSATAYGEFHDDDIPFDDDGYEKDRRIVWRRICKLPEATEEDAKSIVDSQMGGNVLEGIITDLDTHRIEIYTYGCIDTKFISATKCLHSLLKSKGVDINNGNWYLFKKV